MANWRTLELCVVGLVGLVLVTSGLGGGVAGLSPPALDDGTATVTVETFPTERLHVDDGRFGTAVSYLRIPDATVRVDEVRGTPRLIYRVEVPALGVDQSSSKLLTTGRGDTVTMPGTDQAFEPGSVTAGRYDATASVRIQSFSTDQTVASVNETVEVAR